MHDDLGRVIAMDRRRNRWGVGQNRILDPDDRIVEVFLARSGKGNPGCCGKPTLACAGITRSDVGRRLYIGVLCHGVVYLEAEAPNRSFNVRSKELGRHGGETRVQTRTIGLNQGRKSARTIRCRKPVAEETMALRIVKNPNGVPQGPAVSPLPPPKVQALEESMAKGKLLRDAVPRARHAGWKRRQGRADPIEQLQASDPERLPELLPVRYGRMLVSPFTFFRGAAGVMAADLAAMPATGVRVQACGDCHLLNFGGFATPERNIIFDMNDFDETLPAPWEWDVKRLAASFVLAARSNGLSDNDGRDAAVAATRSYRERLAEFAKMSPLGVWYAKIDSEDFLSLISDPAIKRRSRRRLIKAAAQSGSELDYPQLARVVGGQIHIRDAPPLIFHPEDARAPDFMATLEKVLSTYHKSLSDDRRALMGRYRLVDAAIKVVGVGSVGRRCWVALFMSAENHPLFLQFKEARASVLVPGIIGQRDMV
jgi:Uncharacterized protein conserved in bacteria (DUF2252)